MSKVLFITGAASGIGAAIARRATALGHRVVIADVNFAAAAALAASLGEGALATQLDIRSPEQWDDALNLTWEKFGRLDVLINNAGIIHTGFTRDVSLEQHRHTIEVNLLGPLTGIKLALPRLQSQGSGHLITICSMTSFIPMTGMASYGASKHALRAFHHGLALEERNGPLQFTIIHPPATETAMLEQEKQDDAAALAFTASSVTPEFVADTVLQAIIDKPQEIVMPALFGRFLRLLGSNPRVTRLTINGAEAKGRKQLEARRRRDRGQ